MFAETRRGALGLAVVSHVVMGVVLGGALGLLGAGFIFWVVVFEFLATRDKFFQARAREVGLGVF
jgi:hypothetical protein